MNSGAEPSHAVLQLRQDNLAGTMYNLVGFQTNLTYPEQRRVLYQPVTIEPRENVPRVIREDSYAH